MRFPNIAAECARRNMTYDALAGTLGVTRKTIYNWAASGHIPQSAIDKMADLFGVSEEYLRVVEE